MKPMYLTFPCSLARVSASMAPPFEKMTLWVVVYTHTMDLPQVQVVGPQTPQRLLELAHGDRRIAAVRADLRHQEDRVPPVGDGAPHAALALPFVVLPGVV